eukprot:4552961-Amphidinium_carterae.2
MAKDAATNAEANAPHMQNGVILWYGCQTRSCDCRFGPLKRSSAALQMRRNMAYCRGSMPH